MTSLIQKLSDAAFLVFNVDANKKPTSGNGGMLFDWINKTADELAYDLCIADDKGFGMNMGVQGNGRRIMSLDFDVCGDKGPDGKRVGCPHTANKLADYRAGIDRLDGMYSSSTAGNFNVLVDYTDCPDIVAACNKFNVHHLEIIMRGNQVIPPTQTTCKMTGKLGAPRAFLTSEPFYVVTNEPFMLSFLKELFETRITTPVLSAPTAPTATEDKWLDLLFNIIQNQVTPVKMISWDNWFKIAGILKYNKYDLDVFLRYSVPVSTAHDATALWEGNRKVPPMSLYGLQNIAKEVNPFGYRNWINKYQQFIPLATLVKGENDVAKYVCDQLRGQLVYCDGWWRLDKTNLWVHSKKAPLATIISHLQTLIDLSKEATLFMKSTADEARKKQLTEQEEAFAKFYKVVGGAGFSNHIATLLTEYLAMPDFELNSSIHIIAYKNGLLDLKTLEFRRGILSTDMLSQTLEFDYEVATVADMNYVREQVKKICNYNDSHTDYYLGALGYALTGDSSKLCELYYLAGQTASNGKSALLDALTTIMPIYVCKTEKTAFDEGNAKVHKEIGTWTNKRIVWANEVSAAKKNSELLKELTDGTAVKYDKLYSTNALMKVQFKLFMVSNSSMAIKMDAGIQRRFRHLQMDTKFLSVEEGWVADCYDTHVFKTDPSFGGGLRTTYRAAFLQLLFSYSNKFYKTGMAAYPADWKAEKDAVVQANDPFRDFFESTFQVGNFSISKAEADRLVKPLKVNLRDELKRLGISFTYESQERRTVGCAKLKGFWHGFGIAQEPEPDLQVLDA